MNNVKALILGTLLLVPLLVFIFITTFGEHHFTLPTFFPELDAKGEVVRDAKGDTVFKQLPPFELTSQEGQTISQADLTEGVHVANFFFATCTGVCRKMSSQLSRVQETFRKDPSVKIVSYTVNPEHDTVEVLQNYAAQYSAEPNQWYFLTGDREQIYSLAQTGYQVPVEQVAGQQDFIHSEKLMLVDKEQRVRGIYDGLDPVDVDRLIIEIKVLLDEYSKSKER